MNDERFKTVMSAVDDDLLEQAQHKKFRTGKAVAHIAALAACLCIVVGLLWSPWKSEQTEIGPEDLSVFGYELNLPEGAKSVVYELVNLGDAFSVPMAQATFTQEGIVYVCRAQKTQTPADLSQMEGPMENSMNWMAEGMHLQLRENDKTASLSWYEPSQGIQWCLQTEADSLHLISTASQIIMRLGYRMEVAPEGAENVVYRAFLVADMTAAETSFRYEGIAYSYRTAAANTFADLSQKEIENAQRATQTLGWCEAELYYVEGGQGKILWYDIAPGLLYSLYMEEGASAESLMTMAELLYTPAQNDVG